MAEESKQFGRNMWSQSADHKNDAKWLQDLRSEVDVKKREEDRYYRRKFEKDTKLVGYQIRSHQVQT